MALQGLIEGLADFSASGLNDLTGRLSDCSGKRKVFTLGGCGFSALAKTILLVSWSVAGSGAFRVIERLGKGFRGPPRDAWLSALADPAQRCFSFGVHKALEKAHAVGFSVVDTVLLYALFNTTCVAAAPLVGSLGDTGGRSRVVMMGYLLYGAIKVALVWADAGWQVAAFALLIRASL